MPKAEAGRLSVYEANLLAAVTVLPWVIVFVPVAMIAVAGHDAWLGVLPATVVALLAASVATALSRRFPGDSLTVVARKVVGRTAGTLLGALYVFWMLVVGALTVRSLVELVSTILLPRTPLVVVIGTFVAATSLLVRAGVESIARISLLFLVVAPVGLLLLLLFSLPEARLEWLLPVLSRGWVPVAQATYVAAGFLAEVILPSIVGFPFLRKAGPSLRGLSFTTLLLGLATIVSTWWYTVTLGPFIEGRVALPIVQVAQLVSIADFIENLEPLVAVLWVFGIFAKASLWYYGASLSTAQLLALDDYRPLVWPMGLLIGGLSYYLVSSLPEFLYFVRLTATPFLLSFELLLPLCLLAAAYLRTRWNGSRQTAPTNEGD